VLIVEDELLIAFDLEQVVTAAGYHVVGLASRIDEALALVEAEPLDAVLLDIQVCADKTFPVADVLAARGVPFLFLSGHGTEVLPDEHRERPCVIKPYSARTLLRELGALVGTAPVDG
jgi:DNA-binding response OmpR family regulator